jgi:hypothetical protein
MNLLGKLVDKVLQGSHDVASKERLILLCFAVVAELFWQASGSNKSSYTMRDFAFFMKSSTYHSR